MTSGFAHFRIEGMSTYGFDEALSYARTYIDRFGGSTHAY